MRDAEESSYKKRSSDFTDALNTIEEAEDILGSISKGSSSFVELTKVARKMI
jgi:hypothetical protein